MNTPASLPIRQMDGQLLKACSTGDLSLLNDLILAYRDDILHTTTPHFNNCLHIAAMFGHRELAEEVWSRAPSLFCGINIDGETPLIAALMAANESLALDMIDAATRFFTSQELGKLVLFKEMLLRADRRGENVLHHAMRNGFKNLALQLLDIAPLLSEQVSESREWGQLDPMPWPWLHTQDNKISKESPMYMAARKGYSEVVEKLLQIRSSADFGARNESALLAAVRFGLPDIVVQLLRERPHLAYSVDSDGDTPLVRAVFHNNIELVKIFLEHDPHLAYIKNTITETTPFITAAAAGFVSVAEEIRSACPDSVYTPNRQGYNALHKAILCDQPHFVDYVLRTPELHRLINQTTNYGTLPLHHAAAMCDPKILRSLLPLAGQDYTAVNVYGENAVNVVYARSYLLKTLKWIESFTLLSNKIPSGWKHLASANAQQKLRNDATLEIKSLTEKYTSKTSLVAALLATITFAAAFTLLGGFSNDTSDVGLPILARKAAFQVFLISDTIAMCLSLATAFLCILSTWDDLEILLNYRKMTKVLMWCAYGATSLAFGTGLFTVIAPKILWLAILILLLCIILPFISKIIGEWPLLMLRYRLGGQFRQDLIPHI